MPDASRCEVVVVTEYGRVRCVNAGSTRIILDDQGRTLSSRVECDYHHVSGDRPQCVGLHQGARCMNLAENPTGNPQFCFLHTERPTAPTVRGTLTERPTRSQVEEQLLRDVMTWDEAGRVLSRNAEIARSNETLDEQARRIREQAEIVAQERLDQEDADELATLANEESADEVTEEMDTFGQCEMMVGQLAGRGGVQCPNVGRFDGFCEQHREASMPSVNFSQAAIPFVAALVERLGGEVTVPAARLPRGTALDWGTRPGGLRLAIVHAGMVVRTPGGAPAPVAAPPAPTPEAVQVIIERVVDEDEAAARKLLMRCEECGLQFEKTVKTPSGSDLCPYCEVRRLESSDKAVEVSELRTRLRGSEELMRISEDKASRFERMVQEKLDALAQKSSEIRGLRTQLQAAEALLSTARVAPRPAVTPTQRATPTRIGTAPLRERVERGNSLRARIENMARDLGGAVTRHDMRTEIHATDRTPMTEYHSVQIALPCVPQTDEGEEIPF